MTLRKRLILYFCVSSLVTVGVTVLIGGRIVHQEMLSGIDFLLDAESVEIKAILQAFGADADPTKVADSMDTHARVDATLFYFAVHLSEGQIVYESPNLTGARLHLPDLGGTAVKKTLALEPFGEFRIAEYPLGQVHIQIAKSMREPNQIQKQFYGTLLVVFPLVFFIVLVISIGGSRWVLRPVEDIRLTTQRISARNLSERIPDSGGKDELASLARLLNKMFGRLEQSFRQIEKFTAEASHELRTPLALLRLHAEKLVTARDMPVSLQEHADEILQEVDRTNSVLERLFLLTKADAGAFQIKMETIQIAEFVRELYEDACALSESQLATVQLARCDKGTLQADPSCLRQVFYNLLSNALQHGLKPVQITLHSACENGCWTFSVADNGPGVPQEQLGSIFNRFARGINTQHKGAGLGLSISKSLVELHKGTITAITSPCGKGFQITFSLPM